MENSEIASNDGNVHHLTGVEEIPVGGLANSQIPARTFPEKRVYELKTNKKPDHQIAESNVQVVTSRSSMFFHGKSRKIKDDPFLQRLSRLK